MGWENKPMDREMEELIQQMLYTKTKEEILDVLDYIEIPEALYVYAYNYNWDDGFEIPEKIIDKECCDLSTALMIFYKVDGFRYLQEKSSMVSGQGNWTKFIGKLYSKIVNNTYRTGDIKFEPPLNKIQIYKLRKLLSGREYIFIEPIGTKNMNVVF